MPLNNKTAREEEPFFDEIAGEKLDVKIRQLCDAIMEKDEVADFCYELRVEPTPENPRKYILRYHPLFLAALGYEWDKMRKFWEKGYRTLGEDMTEPVCEKIQFKDAIASATRDKVLFTEMAAICFTYMIEHAVTQTDDNTEWMCGFLEEYAKNLKEKNLFADGKILLRIRNLVREMQDGKAYSDRQERFLDVMHDRLPNWYGLLLFGENFWYDIAVDCSEETLGFPSFPLIARRLLATGEAKEGAAEENGEENEWSNTMTHLIAKKEKISPDATKEQKKLFRRMGEFFREHQDALAEGREEELRSFEEAGAWNGL